MFLTGFLKEASVFSECSVLSRKRKPEDITSVLFKVHGPTIKVHTDYKVLLLMFKALNALGPAYLADLPKQDSPSRALHSAEAGVLLDLRISCRSAGGNV